MEWARSGGHDVQVCQRAAESIAAGWTIHFLARDPARGGGLSLAQLRSLERHLHGRVVVTKGVDWPSWVLRVTADPEDAARSDAWREFVADRLLSIAKIRLEGSKKDGKSTARSPHRLSPRALLETHARKLNPTWEYSRDTLQRTVREAVEEQLANLAAEGQDREHAAPTAEPSLHLTSQQLEPCVDATLSAAEQRAWEILMQRSRQRLSAWTSRTVLRCADAPPQPRPLVSCAEVGERHVVAVAVDGKGGCHAERVLDLDDRDNARRQLTELAALVHAELALAPLGEACRGLQTLLDGLESDRRLPWKLVDGAGARWWSNSVHSVTTLNQWTLAAREALFLARRYQRPMETLAELPVEEWAPPELARWLEPADWEMIEQDLTDLLHQRGICLRFAGPKALGRLSAITPLHSQRAAPPAEGWQSLAAFRQSLGVGDRVWQQLEVFLRVDDDGSAPPKPEDPLRQRCLQWRDLSLGMELEGVVTRAATFGVFVDLGAETESLLHVSQMASHFLADPLELVTTGDVVRVVVTALDEQRQRVSLRSAAVQPKKADRGRGKGGRGKSRRQRKPSGKSRSSPSRGEKVTRKRRPAPTPLSKEMAEGKAPLRSFADLVQFYDQKRSEEDTDE